VEIKKVPGGVLQLNPVTEGRGEKTQNCAPGKQGVGIAKQKREKKTWKGSPTKYFY